MAAKSIAVEADVSTSLAQGTSPFTGFDPGGTWAQVSLVVQTRPEVTVGGAATAWKATASFAYTGSVSGAAPTTSPPTPPLVLSGSSTALTVAGQPLLRDGDRAEDSYGNKITVSASGPLTSA